MSLKGRDFLTLKDFTKEEILEFLDLAAELKEKKKKGIFDRVYQGKNIALIFEKTSTRTRCSFEVAAHDGKVCSTRLYVFGCCTLHGIKCKDLLILAARIIAYRFGNLAVTVLYRHDRIKLKLVRLIG